MTNAQFAEMLREMANQVEAGMEASVSIFPHRTDVRDPELGGMVVDAKYHGSTYVMHFGDLEHANDAALAECLKRNRPNRDHDRCYDPPNAGPPTSIKK